MGPGRPGATAGRPGAPRAGPPGAPGLAGPRGGRPEDATQLGPQARRLVDAVAPPQPQRPRARRRLDGQHDLRLACVVAEDVLELLDDRRRQRRGVDAHRQGLRALGLQGGRLARRLDLLDGGPEGVDGLRDERGALVAVIDAPAHEHDLVDAQRALVLGQRLAEDLDLDRALEVVEGGEHHRVALLRTDLLGLGDDAPGRDPVAVLVVGQRGQRGVDGCPQRLAHLLERVRGDEEPDGLLLDGQQLRLLELLGRNRLIRIPPARHEGRGGAGAGAGAAIAEVAEVEDAPLADLGVELRLLARGLRLLEHVEHALARGPGGAEGAALDEGLDRALVDRAWVDAGAEVPDRRELPALLAGRLDRLDGREAHALDRVEPEADVALVDHELVV